MRLVYEDNNEASLHEISCKDFGTIELKYLATAPASQVNDCVVREESLLDIPFMYRRTKGCLPASYHCCRK